MTIDPNDPTITFPIDGSPPYRETIIHPVNGPRYIARYPVTEPKTLTGRRRFDGIKPGDQLVHSRHGETSYWLVTDTWFDPVKGQDNPQKGDMVAVQQISRNTGEVRYQKVAHTIRGLASNGYSWADRDWIEFYKSRLAAYHEGKVVGIGQAKKIRARPKIPGGL